MQHTCLLFSHHTFHPQLGSYTLHRSPFSCQIFIDSRTRPTSIPSSSTTLSLSFLSSYSFSSSFPFFIPPTLEYSRSSVPLAPCAFLTCKHRTVHSCSCRKYRDPRPPYCILWNQGTLLWQPLQCFLHLVGRSSKHTFLVSQQVYTAGTSGGTFHMDINHDLFQI